MLEENPRMPERSPAVSYLRRLTPWLNGDDTSGRATELVLRFIAAFDGTENAAHVAVWPHERSSRRGRWARSATNVAEMELVRARVVDLLRRAFPPEPGYAVPAGPHVMDLPSLQFGARSARRSLKALRDAKSERRAKAIYMAPGAFSLLVDGELRDLLPFLVAHLLTAPGMAVLARCRALGAYQPSVRCGNLIVTAGRGRPRLTCSDPCRERKNAEENPKKKSGRAAARRKK